MGFADPNRIRNAARSSKGADGCGSLYAIEYNSSNIYPPMHASI
jgi:hypothetical protein